MKGVALATLSALVVDGGASNVNGACYETAPADQHYELSWEAKGHNFFDDMVFATGQAQTHGSADYLDKSAALDAGIIETTDTHAFMRVGEPFDSADGPRRHTVHVSTNKRFKHMLAAMRYQHVPFGLGVWPAFWMNGAAPWPENGELDILEYASHAGQKVSMHVGASNHCQLNQGLVEACGEMPDQNGMGFNCYTNYGDNCLGCAPTTFAGSRPPEYWSSHPGALVIEWTERYVKVFYFDEGDIPDDLESAVPQPDTWDEKWVISYFPFAASDEANPGDCPNSADVLGPQEIIMNLELCGDWAGSDFTPQDDDPFAEEWRAKIGNECNVGGSHNPADCCGNYIGQPELNDYLKQNAYWDVEYLKVFELTSGPPPHPIHTKTTTPAPPPSECFGTYLTDTDCDGTDIRNQQVDDISDCCELCSNTTGCGAFTHNVFDGHEQATCYLKKTCEGEQRKAKRGCNSGIPAHIAPTPPPPPPGMCGGGYLDHVDCDGADIDDKPMENADGCCRWCSETPGCTAFTQNMVDGHGAPHCYLKESCDTQNQNFNTVSGSGILPFTGVTTTPPPAPPPTPGCCSWSDDDACGDTTDYCKSNAAACADCGGHWVPDGTEMLLI